MVLDVRPLLTVVRILILPVLETRALEFTRILAVFFITTPPFFIIIILPQFAVNKCSPLDIVFHRAEEKSI